MGHGFLFRQHWEMDPYTEHTYTLNYAPDTSVCILVDSSRKSAGYVACHWAIMRPYLLMSDFLADIHAAWAPCMNANLVSSVPESFWWWASRIESSSLLQESKACFIELLSCLPSRAFCVPASNTATVGDASSCIKQHTRMKIAITNLTANDIM